MKGILRYLSIPLALAACGHPPGATRQEGEGTWTPPPAGTVVAADSIRIDDPLNDFYFAVRLVSSAANDTPGTYGFVYDVHLHAGPNEGMQRITMPRGGRNLKPLLRRAPNGRTEFILGFIPGKEYGGIYTFQDYYSIKADGKNMHVTALKNYSFQ